VLFNSLEFLLFLPLVFAAYWILNVWTDRPKVLRAQNVLILVASYVFYGWWDWRFLSLIIFSTAVDYFVGLQIAKANTNEITKDAPEEVRSLTAKRWLWVSLAVNLGLLGYFKYANFFIENWIEAWSNVGVQMNPWSLQVILPVGISFYTFQTLSYSIDIYRRKLQPTQDIIEFAAFVSFFPQLVAGPIERASKLLPQIRKRRHFDYEAGIKGLQLILFGLFKKVVVADTCAVYVNDIFAHYTEYSGPTLVLGAILFAFQIYGDFSGYSDIAIGTARLFGIRLMTNFRTPYFSRDIAEFWRRWHISLSTWFRDYLYIPLGGSRVGKWKAVRNTFIIFLVSGFWHGANWTFIIWGLIHALLFLPLLLTGRNRKNTSDFNGPPTLREFLSMVGTFVAVTVAWVFFRADSVEHAVDFLMHTWSPGSLELLDLQGTIQCLFLLAAVTLGIVAELIQVSNWNGIFWNKYMFGFWVLIILIYAQNSQSETFIYFQF
jgi:D-alanyl-lipoteichoic acid acyltransferase DltB (MBOAT superfamily)